jgi:hypothetical protein
VVAILFISFQGGGSDISCIIFADQGSQYNHFVTISMNSPGIIHVTRLNIVDAALTVIFIMWQRVCRFSLWLKRRPTVYHWQYETMQHV